MWLPEEHDTFVDRRLKDAEMFRVIDIVLHHEVISPYCKVADTAWRALLTGGPFGREVTEVRAHQCMIDLTTAVIDIHGDSTTNLHDTLTGAYSNPLPAIQEAIGEHAKITISTFRGASVSRLRKNIIEQDALREPLRPGVTTKRDVCVVCCQFTELFNADREPINYYMRNTTHA